MIGTDNDQPTGGGVDGLFTVKGLAELEAVFEPASGFRVFFEGLEHDGCVVHGGDAVWVVGAEHDVPYIKGVAHVAQCTLSVANVMLKEGKVEVGQDGVVRVDTECSFGDDDSFSLFLAQFAARLYALLVQSGGHMAELCYNK